MRPMTALICLTALLATACSGAVTRPVEDDEEPISANAGLMFSLEELQALEEKAMGGSAGAAKNSGLITRLSVSTIRRHGVGTP